MSIFNKLEEFKNERDMKRRDKEIGELSRLREKANIADHEFKILQEKEELQARINKVKALKTKVGGSGFGDKVLKFGHGIGQFAEKYNQAAEKAGHFDTSFPTIDGSFGPAHKPKRGRKNSSQNGFGMF
jgi:mevalonate kinase